MSLGSDEVQLPIKMSGKESWGYAEKGESEGFKQPLWEGYKVILYGL